MASSKLSCPVCNDPVNSLRDLNVHLDIQHPVNTSSSEPEDEGPPPIIDRTDKFHKLRQRQVEKSALNRTKLELRTVRLLVGLQALTGSKQSPASSSSFLWNRQDVSAIREFEKSIVNWEDESVFERCRFCGQRFSFFLGKHHCRICGLVTCGDTERECSLEVPANLLAAKLTDLSEHSPAILNVTTDYPVRVCTECRSVLFSQRNYQRDLQLPAPKILRMHSQLAKLQQKVLGLVPKFEERLVSLKQNALSSSEIAQVRDTRHEVLQLFSQYDALMRQISSVPVETETETQIRQNILAKAATFLETTMLPLQSLPQALRYDEAPKIDKSRAKELQNQMVVLQEQRYLLEKQVGEAKRRRQFDALAPMEMSLNELESEIEAIANSLGQHAPST